MSSTGAVSPNRESCSDGIILDALAEKKYILNDSSFGNLRSKSGSTDVEFSDGQGVKSRFVAAISGYPSAVSEFYASKGLTSSVISGSSNDFRVDWNGGVLLSKAQITAGALDGFQMISRFKYLTNATLDTVSEIQPAYWKTGLSDLTFVSSSEFTRYGSGIGLYPVKAVG